MSEPKKSKRFDYNLESVLKVRAIREKLQQEKFSVAEKEFIAEKQKEEEIKNFQREKYQELRSLISPGKPIENFQEVLMRKSHLEVLKDKVIEQEKTRETAEVKKEDERQVLIQASMNRQIMEKDKDNKKDSWRKLMDKEDSKFLDEIATIRHDRKKRDAEEG